MRNVFDREMRQTSSDQALTPTMKSFLSDAQPGALCQQGRLSRSDDDVYISTDLMRSIHSHTDLHQMCASITIVRCRRRSGLPGDVPEVVEGVVHHVRGEGGDGEVLVVASHAGSLPLVAGYQIEGLGQRVSGFGQFGRYGRRVLQVVPFLNGGGVLIPIGVGGIVLVEHEAEAVFVETKYIADVAGVFHW